MALRDEDLKSSITLFLNADILSDLPSLTLGVFITFRIKNIK